MDATKASSFTIELRDRDKFCMWEEFPDDDKYIFEFKVMRGGNKDVDGYIISPEKKIPYRVTRLPKGFHLFKATNGTFEFCVSNEFSSLANKIVYFSVHRQQKLNRAFLPGKKSKAPTLFEALTENIYKNLNAIVYHQKYFRRKESSITDDAEYLSKRVGWWSFMQAVIILITGFGQVVYMRKFFDYIPKNVKIRQST